jgi:hypothetical protein
LLKISLRCIGFVIEAQRRYDAECVTYDLTKKECSIYSWIVLHNTNEDSAEQNSWGFGVSYKCERAGPSCDLYKCELAGPSSDSSATWSWFEKGMPLSLSLHPGSLPYIKIWPSAVCANVIRCRKSLIKHVLTSWVVGRAWSSMWWHHEW